MVVLSDPARPVLRRVSRWTVSTVYERATSWGMPKLLVSLTGIAGRLNGHTFTPTPDGRYSIAEVELTVRPRSSLFDLGAR